MLLQITSLLKKFLKIDFPHAVLLLSGKRKSGKDFISEKLLERIGCEKCAIVRISEPIKTYYAQEKNLDLKELMSDNPYKETYRLEMIGWSDNVRKIDSGFFCRAACLKAPNKSIWIVSDIRRKSDIAWFKQKYGSKIRNIRILADMQVRIQRGFVFTEGVDDIASECDLDDFDLWDVKVNNNNEQDFQMALQQILHLITC